MKTTSDTLPAAINAQTVGPLTQESDDPTTFSGMEAWGKTFALIARAQHPVKSTYVGFTLIESDARLLASSYTAFDRAGRSLGIDAAELAEKIDIAALVLFVRSLNGKTFGLRGESNDNAVRCEIHGLTLGDVRKAFAAIGE